MRARIRLHALSSRDTCFNVRRDSKEATVPSYVPPHVVLLGGEHETQGRDGRLQIRA
jgi:hypothetical protein